MLHDESCPSHFIRYGQCHNIPNIIATVVQEHYRFKYIHNKLVCQKHKKI